MLQRSRITTSVVAAFVVATLSMPAMAAGQSASSKVVGVGVRDPLLDLVEPGQTLRLSDEKTVTRWAHAGDVHPIRVAATTSSRTITRLRLRTEDKYPEVYVVLDGKVDSAGNPWLRIRIPMRPNGRTGWVPADMLSQLNVVRTQLVIDRRARRAKLFKAGRIVWQAPVGIGKVGTPTPSGNFYVREKLPGGGGVYGPVAFGTSAYSSISDWPKGGVVGIHGTNQPRLVPGRPSHGCVRVRNAKILQLARLMPIGTPISILR